MTKEEAIEDVRVFTFCGRLSCNIRQWWTSLVECAHARRTNLLNIFQCRLKKNCRRGDMHRGPVTYPENGLMENAFRGFPPFADDRYTYVEERESVKTTVFSVGNDGQRSRFSFASVPTRCTSACFVYTTITNTRRAGKCIECTRTALRIQKRYLVQRRRRRLHRNAVIATTTFYDVISTCYEGIITHLYPNFWFLAGEIIDTIDRRGPKHAARTPRWTISSMTISKDDVKELIHVPWLHRRVRLAELFFSPVSPCWKLFSADARGYRVTLLFLTASVDGTLLCGVINVYEIPNVIYGCTFFALRWVHYGRIIEHSQRCRWIWYWTPSSSDRNRNFEERVPLFMPS